MRTIGYLTVMLMLAAGAVFAQDDLFTPMKGTATPSFQMSNGKGRCLVFGTHIVRTTQTEGEIGEIVEMFHREGTVRGVAACNVKAKPYVTIDDTDNNSFYGISIDFFFIDTGTATNGRGLLVYNTQTGSKVADVSYENEPSLVGDRYLMYDSPTDKKGSLSSCTEAAKWKKNGGGVGWTQGKKMDLETETVSNVGGLRCYYIE